MPNRPATPITAGHSPRHAGTNGRRKAAILLLALGEQSAAKLCAELSDRDITNLAIGFADLGRLEAGEVETLIDEFATHVFLSLAA